MKVENFSINLKRVRLERGLSQKKLGKLLGTSQQSYMKWETGQCSPTLKSVNKIVITLGISLEELFR